MATKPTRQQEQACDKLASVIREVTEAARLDGRNSFGLAELTAIAHLVGKASTAFDLDAIVLRALEARGQALGLRSGTAELLTLVDEGGDPLATLLLDDDEFRTRVESAEAELGEI